MAQPSNIQPPGAAIAGVVSSKDAAGNESWAGTLTVGKSLVLAATAAAPVQTPGALTLWTPDGVTLKQVGSAAQSTTTLPGTQINGDLSIAANDPTGGFFLSNTQSVTAGGDILLSEAAVGSKALAVGVTGDANSRYVVDAAGNTSWGPGNATQDTVLGRSAAGILAVSTGSLSVTTAGQGLRVKEGANAKMGVAVLNGATGVVVATTAVTATSRIFMTQQQAGGTQSGVAFVVSRVAGTSFTIASVALDTSTVAWMIMEPG